MIDLDRTLQERVLVLDGPMGTELERLGVDTTGSGWTSFANRTHGDLVTQIHRQYIEAGADIITTNSFRTNPNAHQDLDAARELTFASVSHAQRARDVSGKPEVLIAGSMAPAGSCFEMDKVPSDERIITKNHGTLAKWLAEAGVDLILLETMGTIRESAVAYHAIRDVTSLPLIVSFVPIDGKRILSGVAIEDIARFFSKLNISAILLNCAPMAVIKPAFMVLKQHAGKMPIGAYPNASEQLADGSWDLRATADEAFSESRMQFPGARILGTCCGATPTSTRAINESMLA